MKKIYFDMDGTVYDLYGMENWLEMLRNEEKGAFTLGNALVNMDELKEVCLKLIAKGYQIGIITWLPMGASLEYCEVCTAEKRKWAEKNMPYISEFYALEYGVPKQYAPARRAAEMWLVDDNKEVREMWITEKQRKAIDATTDIIEALGSLLERAYRNEN
jgi:hypothetical protein